MVAVGALAVTAATETGAADSGERRTDYPEAGRSATAPRHPLHRFATSVHRVASLMKASIE